MRMTMAMIAALTLTGLSLRGQEPAQARPATAAQAEAPRMNTVRHGAALVAASRALHYCTGLFSADMSLEQIAATDRSAATAATLAALKTDIDRVNKTVAVTYLPDMPPRVAAWRPSLGCTQLPIGATMEMANHLPRLPASLKHPNFDSRAWPMGDQQATTELPATQRAGLDRVVARAFDGQTYRGATWGVVVIKDGKIVAERYEGGFDAHMPARTNSMCKSLAATEIGRAHV